MASENPQINESLEKANRVRFEQAAWRGKLRSGEVQMAWLIINRPVCFQNLPIHRLFKMQRGWGDKRIAKFFLLLNMNQHLEVGKFTWRQVNLIADKLEGK